MVAKPPAKSLGTQWKDLARSHSQNNALSIQQSTEAKTPKRRQEEGYIKSNSPHPKS